MPQSNLGKIRNKDGTIPNHHVLMGGVGQGICARVDQMLHRIRNSDVERYAKDIRGYFRTKETHRGDSGKGTGLWNRGSPERAVIVLAWAGVGQTRWIREAGWLP